MLPAMPWRAGPHAEPAAVPGEVVEHVAHLPDVDGVEGEVVEVAIAEVDERHHVVVGADVEPDARLAEPVRDPHAEHLGVEAEAGLDVAGEAVHVAEPARRRRGGRSSRDARAGATGRPRSRAPGTASPAPAGRRGRRGRGSPRAPPRRRRATRGGRARRRASSRRRARTPTWSWPGPLPSTSSRQ